MKTCSEPGCTNFVYAKLLCKYHQYKRRMKGGDLYKQKTSNKDNSKPVETRSKPKRYKIPRRTKERDTDEKYYAVQAREFYNEAVANGTNTCIFCGEKVNAFNGLHHWKGRVGKYLLDKLWWSVVHNSCHLFYHGATLQQMRERFGKGFFDRLQKFNYSLWEKLMGRDQKSAKLNPTLFDEEEDENFL